MKTNERIMPRENEEDDYIEHIISKTYNYAEKFVKKVENGAAKSKETYRDMKELIQTIDNYRGPR